MFRGQFQNRFSWALLKLAEQKKGLTDKHLERLLHLCERLLDTNSGRDAALEAIGLALAKKPTLSKKHRVLLNRIVARPEPEVIEHFGIRIWPLLKSWPEFVWSCLDLWSNRMGEKGSCAWFCVLYYRVIGFCMAFGINKRRALKLLKRMLDCARETNNTELVRRISRLVCGHRKFPHENDVGSYDLVKQNISTPEIYGIENADIVRVLTEWLVPRKPNSHRPPAQLERVFGVSHVFFNSTHQALGKRWRREQKRFTREPEAKRCSSVGQSCFPAI